MLITPVFVCFFVNFGNLSIISGSVFAIKLLAGFYKSNPCIHDIPALPVLSFDISFPVQNTRYSFCATMPQSGPESNDPFSGLWKFSFHAKYSTRLLWASYGNPMWGGWSSLSGF